MDHPSMTVRGRSAIRSPAFQNLVDEYEQRLQQSGYNQGGIRFHLHAVVHFGVWIELEDRDLKTIDEETLRLFERHRSTCTCPGTSQNRARKVLSCVRGFLRHLRQQGVVRSVEARPRPVRVVEEFLQWMRVHRGVVETTLASYGGHPRGLRPEPDRGVPGALASLVGRKPISERLRLRSATAAVSRAPSPGGPDRRCRPWWPR